MISISIRQMEVFETIAETGSFSEAAEKLHLTQSTVSMHMKMLEEALNCRLILRGARKKLVLTEDGRRILAETHEILERCRKLSGNGDAETGVLRIGTSTVPAQHLLPELMTEYSKKHTDAAFEVHRGDTDGVLSMLANGTVRIGFVGDRSGAENVVYTPIFRDVLVMVTENSEEYRKLSEKHVTGGELLDRPMVLREAGSGTMHTVDAYLKTKGMTAKEIHVVARMDGPESVKKSVEKGMGVSVISKAAVMDEVRAGQLIAFPLEKEEVWRYLYMVRRKDFALNAEERRFFNYVLRHMAIE